MSDGHWIESLYETFLVRDVVGYITPGAILLGGLFWELERQHLLHAMLKTVPGALFLGGFAYIVGVGLRLLGHFLYLTVFHRASGILGSPWDVNTEPVGKVAYLRTFSWRRNKAWLEQRYGEIPAPQRKKVLSRESDFVHICGIFSMTMLALIPMLVLIPKNGLSSALGISEWSVIIILVLGAVVFLLGHYRHAFQVALLAKANGG